MTYTLICVEINYCVLWYGHLQYARGSLPPCNDNSGSISVSNQVVEKTTQNTVKGIDQCEKNIKFEDVSAKVEQCLPLNQGFLPLLDPFPSQTPVSYLSKEYKIDSFTVDDTFVPGSFKVWYFPQALFAIPQIADVIKHYKYFRSDIQFDLRVASSAFHQGLGQLSWIPLQNGNPDPELPGVSPIYRWSACQPVDVSYAAQQSATICVPYLNPSPYVDLNDTIPPQRGYIGAVIYSQITPYRTTSDIGPFQISVWAKFVNPILAGPLVAAPEHQSDTGSPNSSSTVFSKPEQASTRRYVDPEALVKTTTDALVSNAMTGPIAPVINAVGDGFKFVESAAQAVTSFFGLFDKPTSVKSPSPMMPMFGRDFTLTSGLDSSLRLGQHPTSKLATSNIFPMETSHISMAKLAQIPMLQHVTYFNSSRTSFDLYPLPNDAQASSLQNYTRDYFHYVAAAHAMWRGSLKYRIKFVCGQFIKARIQVAIRFNSGVDTTGQIFTRVVEINGETETLITVPFLWNRYWVYYADPGYNDTPVIQFTLIDTVVGGATTDDPTVDIVIWRAAGEDIQFAGLRSAVVGFTAAAKKAKKPEKRVVPEHQTSLREVFSKPFDSLVCDCKKAMEIGYCTDDMSTTVNDAMKRYVPLPDTETPDPQQYWFNQPINGALSGAVLPVAMEPYWYFKHLFWFERGDLRFRYFYTNSPGSNDFVSATIKHNGTYRAGNGLIYTHTGKNPELQLELPYMSCFPYLPVAGDMATNVNFEYGTGTSSRNQFMVEVADSSLKRKYIAASDNYLAGMLAPPPYVDGSAPAPKTTTKSKT